MCRTCLALSGWLRTVQSHLAAVIRLGIFTPSFSVSTRSRLKIVSIPIGFGNRIIDVFSVESTGAVHLGPGLGRVVIEGMTYEEEAEQAIADVLHGKFGSWLRHSRHPIVMVTDPPAK